MQCLLLMLFTRGRGRAAAAFSHNSACLAVKLVPLAMKNTRGAPTAVERGFRVYGTATARTADTKPETINPKPYALKTQLC